ncbi:hypothetical protein CKO28_01185 [Rhodovibrio sodomensis]|uniref:Uncharacterized protein n=1 Tax=Rhodovibrio sodomensis TaxID=1088 RepID=A0ABS1D8C3_9PROT|nr:hypothetical protein [Rhodovibrio sodomensis]MBK1666657.1 hypothetical protein [Rhodovibrio sodomensis]
MKRRRPVVRSKDDTPLDRYRIARPLSRPLSVDPEMTHHARISYHLSQLISLRRMGAFWAILAISQRCARGDSPHRMGNRKAWAYERTNGPGRYSSIAGRYKRPRQRGNHAWAPSIEHGRFATPRLSRPHS